METLKYFAPRSVFFVLQLLTGLRLGESTTARYVPFTPYLVVVSNHKIC